jgi:hypothetical protein
MRVHPILLFAVLLPAAAFRVSSLGAHLPGIVAVHFDGAGNANGFTTGDDCRRFMLSFTLGAPLFVVLVTALIPRLLPPSMVNVPNRAYWLAPARARQSVIFLSEQGVWFGCIFLAFLVCVDELIARANQTAPPAFPTRVFIGSMVLFFAAIGVWAARMFRRFRLPDRNRH